MEPGERLLRRTGDLEEDEMRGRRSATAVVVTAMAGGMLLAGPSSAGPALAGPALAGLATRPATSDPATGWVLAGSATESYDLAVVQPATSDPCAVPPGGQAPLMCQSGVVPDAEPATKRTPEPDDLAVLLGVLGAGVVAAGAGAVVLARRRSPT